MSHPATDDQILQRLLELGLADPDDLPSPRPEAGACLERLVDQGRVTRERIDALRTDAPGADAPAHDEFRRSELGALGPYRLLEELGRGGMGVVYKAHDARLQRTVAVKTLVAGEHASAELIARFVREAQAAAKLGSHPHIVPVLDVGQEGTKHYIVMEYIEGQSLETMIDEGAIPVRHAARYAAKVARAVQHAHDNGVYHRDLKPANVMVGLDNEPRLTDFGLARLTGDHERLTQSGALVGTPHYMSPEQVQGDHDAIDGRTDVYGMGAVLYEMLTDSPPFGGGATPEIIRKVVLEPPRAPRRANPGVPRDLETICLKALEKPKDRRYDRAGDLAEDLERWLKGEPIAASPISGVSRVVRWAKRKPFAAATLGLATIAIVLVAVVGWTAWAAAAHWQSQVDDAVTDAQYDKYEQALGKFEALLKERPDDSGLQRHYRDAQRGLERLKEQRKAEVEAQLVVRQREAYMTDSRAHLGEMRAIIAELREHWARVLVAQAEMQRLNNGGEPREGDVETAWTKADTEHSAAATQFYADKSRRLEPVFGAFQAATVNAQRLGAKGADELLFAGIMERVRLARHYGDVGSSIQFLERLDGMLEHRADLRPTRRGTLRLQSDPAGAEVWVASMMTDNGLRRPGEFQRHAATSGEPFELPQGNYLIELRKEGFVPARVPVWVRDGDRVGDDAPIRLLRAEQIGERFVYVPRGRTFFGHASGAGTQWYYTSGRVNGFLIGEFEITLKEYCEFLVAQANAGRPTRDLLPMHSWPAEYRPVVLTEGVDGVVANIAPDYTDSPAMGITRHQAMLYASWRSARDGRVYRLPTEREWVRAARGGDMRVFPWGHSISGERAIFEKAFRGGPRPPPRPGMAPLDVSPFGARDMGGSVQEWVSTLFSARGAGAQARGGGWATAASHCVVTARHRVGDDAVTMDFGLRLVAELPAK